MDPAFPGRARAGGGLVIGGGTEQGSAASTRRWCYVPQVQAVIAKSFARIHKTSLVNIGILPLEFADPADTTGWPRRPAAHRQGADAPGGLTVNVTRGTIQATYDLSERQVDALLAGGLLNLIKSQA